MIRMKYPHNVAIDWPCLVNVCANGTISVAWSDIAEQLAKSKQYVNTPHPVNQPAGADLLKRLAL
jgi:hypothetical protein